MARELRGRSPAEVMDGFLVFLAGMASLQAHQPSVARFLLAEGQVFGAQALPKTYDKGRRKLCYANASALVLGAMDLRYAEGYVMSPRTGNFPIEHAWAVDEQGRVVDNTLPTPEANLYFGVAWEAKDLMAWLSGAEVYGVFGGPRAWVIKVLAGEGLAQACAEPAWPQEPHLEL